MTPQEFSKKMTAIYSETKTHPNGSTQRYSKKYDPEGAHGAADDLMCELLESLGFGEAVEIFRSAYKWYA